MAVKVPQSDRRDGYMTVTLATLTNELRVRRQVRHENTALFYGACMQAEYSRIALMLELVEGQRLDIFYPW